MNSKIIKSPFDSHQIPTHSIGRLLYDKLKTIRAHQIGLIDGESGKELSFGELSNLTYKLAAQMIKIHVRRGNVITILSENNWKCVLTAIATFYVGAAVNFVNPELELEELEHLFSICPPDFIFVSNDHLEKLIKLKGELRVCRRIISFEHVPLDGFLNFNDLLEDIDYDMFEPIEADSLQDIAIILTSSGTTGLPKCVPLNHSNLRYVLLNFGDPDCVDLTQKEIILGYLPFFHIYGFSIAVASVFHGAKLVIMKKFQLGPFIQAIRSYKITKLFAVPLILSLLANNSSMENNDLSTVEDIIYGTSFLSEEVINVLRQRFGLKTLRQGYGLTETSGAIAMLPKNVMRSNTVGKLMSTFELKVVCMESGKSLGPHQVGELRFKGDGVMKGYLNNTEATSAIFDQEGFLKSGDLGYYDVDEFIYMLGRLKDVIKYKGFQVSASELEMILTQHPSIVDAAVIGILDQTVGEMPLAFIVKQSEVDVTEEEILSYINGKVCKQKRLRGGVRFVNSIPRTASGKICKWKLQQLL